MDSSRLDRRNACLTLGAMLAGGLVSDAANAADEFPSRPVSLVVPFSPGNAADLWARLVAPRLSALWKQPVVVENKPGAGSMIGVDFVRRANPDGHTLLLGSLSTAMAKLTNANVQFDPQAELAPVCKYLSFKIVIATNAATYAKAKNLQELVALSKAIPDGLFFGGTGPGTALNMAGAFVLQGLGVRYSEVNYNGTPPGILALIRNDVQLLTTTPSLLKQHFDSGALYPLAALGEERFPEIPNTQTVREAGYKGFYPILWNAIYAPKNTPPRVLDRIARDIMAVTTAPDLKDKIESDFSGVIPNSNPQSFAKDLALETKAWREYLTSINFKPQKGA
jgi:tripartite-type tricarboxylate transporter receptor subunit TctC